MAEALTQYKLIILYMLDKVDFPLTNTQISDFILEKEYTGYFTLQKTINELISAELVYTESTHNNTYYHITPAGRETLSYFPDKISAAIKEDIHGFFQARGAKMKQETFVLADYYRTTGREYVARCQIKEKETPLVDLNIRVNTREQAQAVCQNWRKQNKAVYEYLMDLLLK